MPTGEQRLWQAVLITAIEDALQGVSGESKLNRPGADRAAKRYFQQPTRDFLDVCNLAGLDPEAVHDRMMKNLGRDEKHPAKTPQRASRAMVMLTHNGETLSVAEWSKRTGMTSAAILNRVNALGWPVDRALTQPINSRNRSTANQSRNSVLKRKRTALFADSFSYLEPAQHPRITFFGIDPIMRLPMAVRAECNDKTWIVWPAIGQTSDVMSFKKRPAACRVERRKRVTIFAPAVSASKDVILDGLSTLKNRRDLTFLSRFSFRGCNRPISQDFKTTGLGSCFTTYLSRVVIFDCLQWAKFKDDRIALNSVLIRSAFGSISFIDKLVYEPDPSRFFSEEKNVFAVLGMISNSLISSDHLHISDLSLSKILEDAVVSEPVTIAVGLSFLPRYQEDNGMAFWRGNPTPFLSTKAGMKISLPIVNLTHFEAQWHKKSSLQICYCRYKALLSTQDRQERIARFIKMPLTISEFTPGVPRDLVKVEGTGGGTAAQDQSDLVFQQEDAA